MAKKDDKKPNMYKSRMQQFAEQGQDIADQMVSTTEESDKSNDKNNIDEKKEETIIVEEQNEQRVDVKKEDVQETSDKMNKENEEDTPPKTIKPKPKKKVGDIFGLTKKKPSKEQCSYYLESNVDKAFELMGKITNVSKSELVNLALKEFLTMNEGVETIAENDSSLQELLDNL